MKKEIPTISVPVYILEEVANTLRLVSNAMNSPKRESCLDRNVMRSWNHVADLLKGRRASPAETLDYYSKVGQTPHIEDSQKDTDPANAHG